MHDRYHVVVVSKYLGMYRKRDPIAFAVADHERANSIVSRKYDSLTEAEVEASRLNTPDVTVTRNT